MFWILFDKFIYDNVQMVFGALIKQLHGLAKFEDPSFVRVFYILESLATVKSSIILCELAGSDDGTSRAEELLVELFDCLLSGLRCALFLCAASHQMLTLTSVRATVTKLEHMCLTFFVPLSKNAKLFRSHFWILFC